MRALILALCLAGLLASAAHGHGTLVQASTVKNSCANIWGAANCYGAVRHQGCQLLYGTTGWYCKEWGMLHPGPDDWYHGGYGWRNFHH